MGIKSFDCKDTEALFNGRRIAKWVNIEGPAMRKLAMLNQARALTDLRVPPNNHLEALKKERRGQHSIRISGQWRLCFVWTDDGPKDVEIVDYH